MEVLQVSGLAQVEDRALEKTLEEEENLLGSLCLEACSGRASFNSGAGEVGEACRVLSLNGEALRGAGLAIFKSIFPDWVNVQ